ncbi:rhamnose ABC transporter substrate-binding protein [Clostridia bacterium]|nr:rhamnose ABC transporter substrate-binding protein [Clostridia bacterium]
MTKAPKWLALALALTMALTLFAGAAMAETYAIIVKSTGNPYNDREASGFEEACKELGIPVVIKAPANITAEDQIAMIEELLAQEISGIAIAANDPDALEFALTRAMSAGVAVVAVDSNTNVASRQTFANQADTVKIGQTLVEAAFEITGGEGQFAILSATAQATNQNAWIAEMQKALEDPKYAKLELVKIAYGDDLRDKSVSETEGLIQTYPELKCIIAPTTVGIAAASKVVIDQGLSDKLKVSGLGLPSEMAEYIDQGVCPFMYLWNPIDLGYLTGYTVDALVKGTITGAAGDTFTAGRLGEYVITEAADGGTEVLLGPPFKFEPSNIADWKDVY